MISNAFKILLYELEIAKFSTFKKKRKLDGITF